MLGVAISHLKSPFQVLGLHLVVTEVVPVSGSVDEKVNFISIKITSGYP